MTSTTAGGTVGQGGRARLTVVALQAFLDGAARESQSSYAQAMRRDVVREALHRFAKDHALHRACSVAHADTAPAMTFLRQLVRLFRADATPAELYQLATFPQRMIQRLVEAAPRALEAIDLDETKLDGHEDELQTRRHVFALRGGCVGPVALREEAAQCRRAAALYTEREHALIRAAEQLEARGGLVA